MICEICNMKIKMPKKILSSLIKKSTFEEITLPLCSLYYYQFLQQFFFFVSYSYASWWFNVHILTLSLSSAYFYYKLFLISQPKNCRSYFWKHSALHTWATWCWTDDWFIISLWEFQMQWEDEVKYLLNLTAKEQRFIHLFFSLNIMLFNTLGMKRWFWKDWTHILKMDLILRLFNPNFFFVFSSHKWFLFFFWWGIFIIF